MSTTKPCIDIPSPQQIQDILFKTPAPSTPDYPTQWNAQLLLTPFGGVDDEQLVVGNVTYDASNPAYRIMRIRLYLIESLVYYDFLFVNSQCYWLLSDPNPNHDNMPTAAFGPFPTEVRVPPESFFSKNEFAYQGTSKVVGYPCDAFAAKHKEDQAGTWYWFYHYDEKTLHRIMNVDNTNDYKIPILGAYYLVHVALFSTTPQSLWGVYSWCQDHAQPTSAPSDMLTLRDIQTAMNNPPTHAAQIPCTMADVNMLVPGISVPPPNTVTPPAWTNRVESACYMVGQDVYPYFCHVWYDWDYGDQLTVFVMQDKSNIYNQRQDELLPKGHTGPAVNYEWSNSQWEVSCVDPKGSFVPMPVPDFVQAGGGKCRAVIEGNTSFGSELVTIWSIAMGPSTFWDWFDGEYRGILFSLAPAGSLTLIDYQTFEQNPTIESCVFDEPDQPLCPEEKTVTRVGFKPH